MNYISSSFLFFIQRVVVNVNINPFSAKLIFGRKKKKKFYELL